MTKIIIAFVFFISSLVSAQNVNLTVSISGLKSNTGLIQVGLFNSEGKFLKSAYKGISSEIKSNAATVTFMNIPKGEYAISVYHDKNKNGKLDTNFMGIPSEDFACSNNAKGFMGPPKYQEAKFDLVKDSKIEVKFNN
jgi:uncharacterized protein (DUF2141 family)